MFENPDPEQSLHLTEPALSTDYGMLSAEAKAEADELQQQGLLLFYYYRIFNGYLNKPHLEALCDLLLLPCQVLVDRVSRQWNGNLVTLKGASGCMVEYWPHLPQRTGYYALYSALTLN